MTTTDHRAAAGTSRRPSRTTYAYQDDPTFHAFRGEVWKGFDLNHVRRLSNSKLYALWYVSKTFSRHWKERPSNKTANDMIFILGHNFLTVSESQLVMTSWLKLHFPKISQTMYEKWVDDFFFPTWERIQPGIEKARQRKNARRREKRNRTNGQRQEKPRGSTLKQRILEVLREHPMTTALLASKLNAHPKAVDGQLSRLIKTGAVVKLGRGLYALPGAMQNEPVHQQPAMPIQRQPAPSVPLKSPAIPTILDAELEEGVAEWTGPQALEPVDRCGMDIPAEIGVCYPPSLKTAEPNWNRKW